MIWDTDILKAYLQNLGLNKETINEIIPCFQVRSYHQGDYFANMGELSDRLGFVMNGIFYMYIEKDDGTFYTKDFITKGQFMLASFNPQKESSVNIQAVKDSVILESKYSDIQKLFVNNAEFEALSKKSMEQKIEQLSRKLELMATMEGKERYLFFLREYQETASKIPQYMVASYLNITPTQLSRIKKQLSK